MLLRCVRGFVTVAVVCWVLVASSALAAGLAMDTRDLQSLLHATPESVFLLDVRTPREFAAGRISGSVLIPMNQVPSRLAEVPKDKRVVVVCASGARSAAVVDYLQRNGYPDAVNYSGGVFDWARKGLPVEK